MAITFTPLSRSGWSASATSTFSGTYLAANVLDGNTATSCISTSGGGGVGWELTINFGSAKAFDTLQWRSRTDASDACIKSFEVYVSSNGSTWGSPVASGYWPNIITAFYEYLGLQTAQYIKVKSVSIYGTFAASCSEINVGSADYARFSPLAMDSNATPSPFVASASSEYPSAQYYAHHAFEEAPTSSFWASFSTGSGWLKLDLGTGITNTLQWYSIRCDGETPRQPRDWTMEGSNNNSTWTTLDTVTGQTGWSLGQLREFTCDVTTTAYRYFRLNISVNNNTGDLVRVDMLTLHATAAVAVTPMTGYVKITVDHTKVLGALTDFPVLVSISAASFLKTVANGGLIQHTGTQAGGMAVTMPFDLVFSSDAAGSSTYPWEIETYDPATGHLLAWVKLPALSASVDTVFYMPLGNALITTQQNTPANVWDANYKGVWHLGDGTTLSGTDSSSGAYHFSFVNSPTAIAGKVGGAIRTEAGASQYAAGASGVIGVPALTMEGWMRKASGATDYGILFNNQGNIYLAGGILYTEQATGVGSFYVNNTGGLAGVADLRDDTWHHFAGMISTSGTVFQAFYLDGVLVASITTLGAFSPFIAGVNNIGLAGSSLFGSTDADEVRMSDIARSPAWVQTGYASQNAPGDIGAPNFLIYDTSGVVATAAIEDRIAAGSQNAVTARESTIGGYN